MTSKEMMSTFREETPRSAANEVSPKKSKGKVTRKSGDRVSGRKYIVEKLGKTLISRLGGKTKVVAEIRTRSEDERYTVGGMRRGGGSVLKAYERKSEI